MAEQDNLDWTQHPTILTPEQLAIQSDDFKAGYGADYKSWGNLRRTAGAVTGADDKDTPSEMPKGGRPGPAFNDGDLDSLVKSVKPGGAPGKLERAPNTDDRPAFNDNDLDSLVDSVKPGGPTAGTPDAAAGMSELEKGAASGVSQVLQLGPALKLLGSSAAIKGASDQLAAFDKIDAKQTAANVDPEGKLQAFDYEQASPAERAQMRQQWESAVANNRETQKAAATAWLEFAKEQEPLRGRVPSISDVHNAGDFGAWLANKGMANAVSLAPILMAAAIPVVGPAVAGAGIAAQGFAGATGEQAGKAVAAAPEGSDQAAAAASGVEQNLGTIGVSGAANTALNFVPGAPVGRLAGAAAGPVRNRLASAAAGGATQASVGAAQAGVSQLATEGTLDPKGLLEGAAEGGVVGAGLGAAHGHPAPSRAPKPTVDDIATSSDPVATAMAAARATDEELGVHTQGLVEALNRHLSPEPLQLGYHEKTQGEVVGPDGLPVRGPGDNLLPDGTVRPAGLLEAPSAIRPQDTSNQIEHHETPPSAGPIDTDHGPASAMERANEAQMPTREVVPLPKEETEPESPSMANLVHGEEAEPAPTTPAPKFTPGEKAELRGQQRLPLEGGEGTAPAPAAAPAPMKGPSAPAGAQGRLFESRPTRPEPGQTYAGPGDKPVEAMGVHQLPERTATNPVSGVSRGDATAAQQLLRTIGKRIQIFKGDSAFFDPRDPNTIHVGDQVKSPLLAIVGHEVKHIIDTHFPELSKPFDDVLQQHMTPELAGSFRKETHTPEEVADLKGQREKQIQNLMKQTGVSRERAEAQIPDTQLHKNYGMEEFGADTFGTMWTNERFFSDVMSRVQELGIQEKHPGSFGKAAALIVRMTRTMMKGLRAPTGVERFATSEALRHVQELHDAAVEATAQYYRRQQRPAREMEAQRLRDAHEVSRIPLFTKGVQLHPSITRRDNGKPNGNPEAGQSDTAPAQGSATDINARNRGEIPGRGNENQARESRNSKTDGAPVGAGPERDDTKGVRPLEGSPPGNRPSQKIREVARRYMEEAGLPYNPPTRYAKVDPERGARVARAYEEMEHNPHDPEVKAAYEALAHETKAQFDAMTRAGVKTEFMKPGENPYPNPRRAIDDIHNNDHLSIYPTDEGFGTEGQPDRSDNPLLADSGRRIGGKPAKVNDLFRAVHDYFGHAKEGVGFRADGEENAWRMHSAMFSPEARRAMTSETRGQNSWVNYGPHAEFNRKASQEDTKYAEQKTGLLPKWASEEGVKESRASKTDEQRAAEDKAFTTGGHNHLDLQRQLLSEDGLGWTHEGTDYHIADLSDRVGANANFDPATNRYRIEARKQYLTDKADSGEAARTLYHEHMHVADWNGNLYSDHPDMAPNGRVYRELESLYNRTTDPEVKSHLNYPFNREDHPSLYETKNEWKRRAELFAQAATMNKSPKYAEILRNESPTAKAFLDTALQHAREHGHIPGDEFERGSQLGKLQSSFNDALNGGAARNPNKRPGAGRVGDERRLSPLESRAERHDRITDAVSLRDDLYGDREVPKLKTLRDVGAFLDQRAAKGLRGLDLTRDTPENRTALAGVVHDEARRALQESGNAGEWYRDILSRAIDHAAEVYPELKTDPRHEFAFKTALAITSNGQTIAQNVRMAFESYEHYRRTGQLGSDISGGGDRMSTIKATLEYVNSLSRQMGEDRVREALLSKMPVRDIERVFGRKLPELKDQEVYAGSVLGPKIGGGFLPNLMGRYDTTTIDRWLMRTWGRLTGDLQNPASKTGLRDSPSSGGQRAMIRGTMDEALNVLHADHPDLTHAGLQATLWYPEKQLYNKLGVVDKRGVPTDYEKEIRKHVDETQPTGGPVRGQERGGGRAPRGEPEPAQPERAQEEPAGRRVSDEEFLRESRAARDPIQAIKDDPEDGLRRPGWGVLTATRESVGPHDHPDNIAANRRLEDELRERGIPHERVAGSYEGVDQGPNYLVAAGRPELHDLRDRYGQDSVLTNRGLEYNDGTIHPALHEQSTFGPEAEKQPFFSRLSNGKPFSMGVDFDNRVADDRPLRPEDHAPTTFPSHEDPTLESRAPKKYKLESQKDGESGARGKTFSSYAPNTYHVTADGEHIATATQEKDPRFGGETTHWATTWHRPEDSERPTSFQYLRGHPKSLAEHVKQMSEQAPTLESRAQKPIWRSRLDDELDRIPSRANSGQGWLDAIRGAVKAGRVHADELEWSGLPEFLRTREGKVSKEDVKGFLADHGLRVGEHVSTAENAPGEGHFTDPDAARRFLREEGVPHDQTEYSDEGAIRNANELYSTGGGETPGAPRYSNYQLPGGENYREMLLTLGGSISPRARYEAAERALHARIDEEAGRGRIAREEAEHFHADPFAHAGTWPEALGANRVGDVRINHKDRTITGPIKGVTRFESPHWDEPDVLAHVRMNDRTDDRGRRVLHVEEIQSDWGQAAKRRGFADNSPATAAKLEALRLEANKAYRLVQEIRQERTQLLKSEPTLESPDRPEYLKREAENDRRLKEAIAVRDAHERAYDELERTTREGVQRAPFVGKTADWTGLAMKRIIRHAAENGYDAVSWTNGDQQAARYDLSSQIKRIRYDSPAPDGRRFVEAIDNYGNVHMGGVYGHGALVDHLGKELADRITADDKRGDLSGLDLKLGGEGMRGYYDRILPNVTNDILKKMGGGRVGTVDYRMSPTVPREHPEFGYEDRLPKEKKTQPGFDITPAMREKANEGMPLMSRAQKEVRSEWDSYTDLTPEQLATLRKVGAIVDPLTLRQRWEQKTANWRERAVAAVVDDFHPLMGIERDTQDPADARRVSTAYMLSKLSRGYNGTMEALLRYGKIKLTDGVPDVDVNDPSGGFANVLSNLKGETQRALMWVASQRAEQLKANGLENLFDAKDIANLKTTNQGKMADGSDRATVYHKFLKDLTDYNNAGLNMAQESGLISPDTAQLFRDHPYVPFYRVQEDIGKGALAPYSKAGLSDQKAWSRLKGGKEALQADLLENVLGNWAHIFQASAKNRAALATVDALLKHHTDVIEHIPPGSDVPKGSFQVMRDGAPERYLIHDPLVAQAVSSFNYVQPGWVKALGKPKQLLTAGITLSPFFRTRIAIREALASLIQSPIGTNPVANVLQGWKNTDAKSAIFASTMASGAQIRFGQSERSIGALKLAKRLTNVHADEGVMASLGRQIGAVWEAYHELGNKTENFNRTALYEQLRNKVNPETGVPYTHAEASFAARDLLDFSAGGNHSVVKFLSSTVPFMNARAQGLYSIGKTFANDPHGMLSLRNKVTAVTMAACAASLALMLSQKDDPWWQGRTQQDRDAYWGFRIGNHAFRIPKPFELGAAASMAERTWELAADKNMTLRKYGSNFGQVLMNSLSFDPTPQFVKPLFSLYSNKDPTTQAPIETTSDKRELPEDRYDENTTRVARVLGRIGIPNPVSLAQATYEPLSPKQIDYAIGAYTSSYGLMAAAALDYAHAAISGEQKPAMTLKQMTGSYASDVPEDSSRYVAEMHEHLKGIEEAYASYQQAASRGDMDKARQVLDAHPEARMHSAASAVDAQMSAINTMIKRAEASSLSADEKRRMITGLRQRKNAIAERFEGTMAPK